MLGGCAPAGSSDDPVTAPSPTISAPATRAPTGSGSSTSDAPRPEPVELSAGDVRLAVSPPTGAAGSVAVAPAEDGSARLTVDFSSVPTGTYPTATPTGPGALTVHTDGSLTVVGADGVTAAGGLARPDGGRWRTVDARTAELVPTTAKAEGTVTTTLGTDGVESAVWGDREGGRSLAVDPTAWARSAGEAGVDVVWSELVADDPDLDTATMHDQLVCHAVGAPDKETWNLEPWRPDVGLLAVLAERCNPTEGS